MLSPDESARYARHLVLKGIGGAGQQKMRSARVLVIGAGGLGSPIIAYLAAAGVGHLGIADFDRVSLSNLQRQILFTDADEGRLKAEAAAGFAAARNPYVQTKIHDLTIDAANIGACVRDYDLVVEGTDSFSAKAAIAQACEALEIPLVSGSLGPFDGSLTVLKPYQADNPRLGDLYPHMPSPDDSPPCELAGVLSVLPGIVGTMMANEVLKLIAGYGEPLVGRLLIYSARSGETTVLRYARKV